jgi:hypothetical protein
LSQLRLARLSNLIGCALYRRQIAELSTAADGLGLAAFVGAVVLGGSNVVAVRYANRELDLLWGAGLRFGLAAVVFGVLVAALRLQLPRGRVLGSW